MAIPLSNTQARKIFLERQGLSRPPQRALGKAGLYDLIHDLGFVQVDSIATVERAHHQILFSRNQTYRPEHLTALLEKDRSLFEHWTHDASIIPSAFFPYWKHRFVRREARILENWAKWQGEGFDQAFEETYEKIRARGPIMAREVKAEDHKSGGWWNWHPSKTALEFLWHTGKLAIAGRDNFQKVYDLSERVIPPEHFAAEVDHDAFVDWACRQALTRLGFATHGEIAAFFDLVTPQEAKAWVEDHRDELEEVSIETVDGKPRASFAFADSLPALLDPPEPPARIRTLSPFDPLIRDPQPHRTPVRLLLPHRNLRARAEARIRLLRLPAPGIRPPDRPHRHEGRPQGRHARRETALAGKGRQTVSRATGEAGGGAGAAGEVCGRGAGGISRRLAGVRGKAEGCNGPHSANCGRMKCASLAVTARLIVAAPKAKAATPYLAQHFPRGDRQQCGLSRRSSSRSGSLELVDRTRLVHSQQ